MRTKPLFVFIIFFTLLAQGVLSENVYSPQWRVVVTQLEYVNGTYVMNDTYIALVSNLRALPREDGYYNVTFTVKIEEVWSKDKDIEGRIFNVSLFVKNQTNTFIIGNKAVFFPFYWFGQNISVKTYHLGIPLEFEKSKIIIGENFENGTQLGVGVTTKFEIRERSEGIPVKVCNLVDINGTCFEWEISEYYPDFTFRGPYGVDGSAIYPKDPFGVFDGPVNLMFKIVLDNQTIEFLRSLPEPKTKGGSDLFLLTIPLIIAVLTAWRWVRK